MTDRELLELAAKAAGKPSPMMVNEIFGLSFGGGWWNPLTDDGDALRLAVKMGLHVTSQAVEVWRNGQMVACVFEDGADQYADTRRAIVRAAAARWEPPESAVIPQKFTQNPGEPRHA